MYARQRKIGVSKRIILNSIYNQRSIRLGAPFLWNRLKSHKKSAQIFVYLSRFLYICELIQYNNYG
jgi:hypothetical protein